MKVVILAGGLGTRLSEETEVKPKPMVEIGGRPILWHIMKHYAHYGFKEFLDRSRLQGRGRQAILPRLPAISGSMTVHLATGRVEQHESPPEDWTVHLFDTGLRHLTGGRVKRLQHAIGRETFMVTYGDGVGNVDLRALLRFHKSHGKLATVTAVRPPARFGGLVFDGDRVARFTEKPQIGEGWINGGFLVFEPEILDQLADDGSSLEADLLERLASEGQLAAYRHDGFWQCMDTLRDVRLLESLWQGGSPPWKVWR